MRIWTQNPRGKSCPEICLRHRCVHTEWSAHILTPPHSLLQILSRPAFYLFLRLSHEASSLEGYDWKGHRLLVTNPLWWNLSWKFEPWRWTLITICKAGSPILPFRWGQQPLPHPVVAPSCKIYRFYSAAYHMASWNFLPVLESKTC